MSALVVGSQYRFEATLTRNRAVWDLTGATVTINFKRSDGTTFTQSASLLAATTGQVNYDCTTSDLDMAGNWTRSWKIVLSTKTYYTLPVQFVVSDSP